MTQVPLPAPVVQPGYPAHRRIVEAFGTEVLMENGDIDRKVLGDLIFNQPDRRHLLNSITHPEICKEMMKETFKYFLRGKSWTWDQAGQSRFLQAQTLLCRDCPWREEPVFMQAVKFTLLIGIPCVAGYQPQKDEVMFLNS